MAHGDISFIIECNVVKYFKKIQEHTPSTHSNNSYLSMPSKAHSIDKSVIFLIFVDVKHFIQIWNLRALLVNNLTSDKQTNAGCRMAQK